MAKNLNAINAALKNMRYEIAIKEGIEVPLFWIDKASSKKYNEYMITSYDSSLSHWRAPNYGKNLVSVYSRINAQSSPNAPLAKTATGAYLDAEFVWKGSVSLLHDIIVANIEDIKTAIFKKDYDYLQPEKLIDTSMPTAAQLIANLGISMHGKKGFVVKHCKFVVNKNVNQNEIDTSVKEKVAAIAEQQKPQDKTIKAKNVKLNVPKHAIYDKLKNMPEVFEGYHFPRFIKNISTRIIEGRPILVSGPAGCGKTEMIEKMAKMVNKNYIRVNFYSGVSEFQLVGKYIVKESKMQFVYGYLPLAMKNGWWLMLDEIDYAQPENLALLQPVLEGKDLVVVQNEGEIIKPHPDFRLFATGNTKGRGDASNSYSGTNILNASFMDRFSVFEMKYSEKEKEMVQEITGDEYLAALLVQLFKIYRKSSEENIIVNSVFSTRRLLSLAKTLTTGEPLVDALYFEIFTRYDESEAEVLLQNVNDVFDQNHYLRGWKLGDDHLVSNVIKK